MGRSREEIAFYGLFAKTGSRDPEARSSWGKLAAATSCQIDRRPTTVLVVDLMCDDLKATASKDHPILLKCQAGVIKRLATETSKLFPTVWPRRKHQDGLFCCQAHACLEDNLLVVRRQVKEAVPGDQAIKSAIQFHIAHISDQPLMAGKARTTKRNQRWRSIDASHLVTVFDAVARDGLPSSASDVQYRSLQRQMDEKPVQPMLLHQRAAARPIKIFSICLVQRDNIACRISRHDRFYRWVA